MFQIITTWKKMSKEIDFIYSDTFAKDLKKLKKKYSSLEDDIELLQLQLANEPDSHIQIAGIGTGYEGEFYKVKKFRCQSLSKSSLKSGIRIIYYYREDTGSLEFCEIEFIEIYHKNTQTDFDRTRLEKYRKV